jgi:hypothetical protein
MSHEEKTKKLLVDFAKKYTDAHFGENTEWRLNKIIQDLNIVKIEKLTDDLENAQDNVEARIKHLKIIFLNNQLKAALKKAEVIINNGANMAESSVLKNAMLLSLSSLNLTELLKDEQPTN